MKVEVISEGTISTTNDLRFGDIGEDHHGHHYIRVYSDDRHKVAQLESPDLTWSSCELPLVRIYRKGSGTTIKLIL